MRNLKIPSFGRKSSSELANLVSYWSTIWCPVRCTSAVRRIWRSARDPSHFATAVVAAILSSIHGKKEKSKFQLGY